MSIRKMKLTISSGTEKRRATIKCLRDSVPMNFTVGPPTVSWWMRSASASAGMILQTIRLQAVEFFLAAFSLAAQTAGQQHS